MDKRKRTLSIVGGIVVLALGVGAFVRSRPHDLVLIGVVDANEIVVTPPVQARLDSLWVEEGTEVKAGQPIASLDRGELAAQAQAAGASAPWLAAPHDHLFRE
jgi:multidrug efflux pump subunit AcrA (membrane-fusion protein)